MRVCDAMAGIGGWSLAFEDAGAEILWQFERDPLRQAVLREHWPYVNKKSDLRQISPAEDLGDIDVLTASLSFAHHGKNGTFDALWQVIDQIEPSWLVIEHRSELFDIRNHAMGKELEAAAHDRGYFYQYAIINANQIEDTAINRYRGYMVAYNQAPFRNCLPLPHSEGAYPEEGISRTGRYQGKSIGIRTAEKLMGFGVDWTVSVPSKFRWDAIRDATSVQVAKKIANNIVDVEGYEDSNRSAREGQVAAVSG